VGCPETAEPCGIYKPCSPSDPRIRWERTLTPSGELVKLKIRTRHKASTSTRLHFAFALCCHSNETRPPIANPPNSAQLQRAPYHCSRLHPGPCSSVGMRRGTDRHTDRHIQTAVTTIYFASSIRLMRNVINLQQYHLKHNSAYCSDRGYTCKSAYSLFAPRTL